MSCVRRPRAARALVALGVTCGLALGGCSDPDDSAPRPAAAPTTAAADDDTTLEDLDTTALVVARAPFCDAVDPGAVEQALGAEPAEVSAHRSGQRIRLSDDLADVVHEFGCRWTAGDDTAEAWVFAPPVTRRRATVLARDVTGLSRCRDEAAPDFGSPSGACVSADADAVETRFAGLFGDAWLTCSLTLGRPAGDVDERASRWCAAVAVGAGAAG